MKWKNMMLTARMVRRPVRAGSGGLRCAGAAGLGWAEGASAGSAEEVGSTMRAAAIEGSPLRGLDASGKRLKCDAARARELRGASKICVPFWTPVRIGG